MRDYHEDEPSLHPQHPRNRQKQPRAGFGFEFDFAALLMRLFRLSR